LRSQRGFFKGYIMSTAQGKNCICENWLVDSSDLLSDGTTRVIFYNPYDEYEIADAALYLEGLKVEELITAFNHMSAPTYKKMCQYERLAKQGILRNWANF